MLGSAQAPENTVHLAALVSLSCASSLWGLDTQTSFAHVGVWKMLFDDNDDDFLKVRVSHQRNV